MNSSTNNGLSAGDTIEEAVKNAENAKRAWFEAVVEDGTVFVELE